jgi:hypothetical protein
MTAPAVALTGPFLSCNALYAWLGKRNVVCRRSRDKMEKRHKMIAPRFSIIGKT